MIDLTPEQFRTVRNILDRFLPGIKVRVYGPRVTDRARPDDDLDLCIMNDALLSLTVIGQLRDAFEVADLPFDVFFAEWVVVSGEMRKRIEREGLVLGEG